MEALNVLQRPEVGVADHLLLAETPLAELFRSDAFRGGFLRLTLGFSLFQHPLQNIDRRSAGRRRYGIAKMTDMTLY